MRFYLSVIIILLTISIGMFFGGINISVVFNISEWLLITGIAVGSFIMSNSQSILKQLLRSLSKILLEKPYNKSDYLELLAFMFAFFKHTKSLNMNELELEIDHPEQSKIFNKYPILLNNKEGLSFFQNHFRILTLGFQDMYEVENMMENEIAVKKTDSYKIIKALNKLGDSLPALGIVAAVLGVIGAMSAAGAAPEILGARVAGALIGTFAGVFFAYCIVNPIASFLEKFQNDEIAFIECMKIGMISYMKGHPTPIAVEFARQIISSDLQPTFNEVEEVIYNSDK